MTEDGCLIKGRSAEGGNQTETRAVLLGYVGFPCPAKTSASTPRAVDSAFVALAGQRFRGLSVSLEWLETHRIRTLCGFSRKIRFCFPGHVRLAWEGRVAHGKASGTVAWRP